MLCCCLWFVGQVATAAAALISHRCRLSTFSSFFLLHHSATICLLLCLSGKKKKTHPPSHLISSLRTHLCIIRGQNCNHQGSTEARVHFFLKQNTCVCMRNKITKTMLKKAEFSSSIQSNFFFYVSVRMRLKPCHERGVLGLSSWSAGHKGRTVSPGRRHASPRDRCTFASSSLWRSPPTLFPFKEHILFICPPYALFIHGGGFEVQAL